MTAYQSVNFGGHSHTKDIHKTKTMTGWRQQKKNMMKTNSLPNIRKRSADHVSRKRYSKRDDGSLIKNDTAKEGPLLTEEAEPEEEESIIKKDEPESKKVFSKKKKLKTGEYLIRLIESPELFLIVAEKGQGSQDFIIEL